MAGAVLTLVVLEALVEEQRPQQIKAEEQMVKQTLIQQAILLQTLQAGAVVAQAGPVLFLMLLEATAAPVSSSSKLTTKR